MTNQDIKSSKYLKNAIGNFNIETLLFLRNERGNSKKIPLQEIRIDVLEDDLSEKINFVLSQIDNNEIDEV